ncbi:hypothetical protein D9M71_580290 [compost metagenome]
MPGLGGETGQFAVIGQGWRRRADETPQHAKQHHCQQHKTNALVQVGGVFAPWAVVVQPHHPQAQSEQSKDCQCDTPVHEDADKAVTRRRISQLHCRVSL